MDRKNIFIWGILFLAMVFFCPQISQAKKSKITVDKAVIDLNSQAGEDVEFSFSLRNDSDENQKINLAARDIRFEDGNEMKIEEAQGGPSSLVVFDENEFVIGPRDSRSVSGIIKLSQEKKEASFYNMMAIISFSNTDEKDEAGGPKIIGKIGVYLFVKIGENHDASGKIESIYLSKFLKKNDGIDVSYKNVWDVYFIPQNEVKIKNFLSGFEENISLDRRFVFPDKNVVFSGKLEDVSPWGFFRVKIKFIDGNGNTEMANKYACGYLFPIVAIAIPIIIFLTSIFIMRKRNQMDAYLMEKNKK